MKRLIAAALISLCLISALPAQDEYTRVHGRGIPLLLWHTGADLPQGGAISAWQIMLLFRTRFETDLSNEVVDGKVALFPLFHFRTQDEGQTRYFFPAYWFNRNDPMTGTASRGWSLIPFVWWSSAEASGLDVRTRIITLFYRHAETVASEDEREGPTEISNWGVFPALWGWRNGEFHHLHLVPLMFWRVSERFTLFPLIWSGEDYLALGPLFGWYETTYTPPRAINPEGVEWTPRFKYFLFPLYVYFNEDRGERDHYSEHHLLWPIFAWGSGPSRIERRLNPIWRYGRQEVAGVEHSTANGLFPFYWRERYRAGGRVMEGYDVVFPFYWDMHSLVPGEVSEQESVGDTQFHLNALFPLWIRETVNGETRDLSIMWPFYIGRWRPESPGTVHWHRIAGLLSGYRLEANGDSVFDILFRVFRRERSGPEIHSRLLWFVFATDRDTDAETARVALLWRFFEYEREGDARGLRLLYLPWQIPLP